MIPKDYKTKTKQYFIEYILPPYQFKKGNVIHYHFQISNRKNRFEYDVYLSKKKVDKFNITDSVVEGLIGNGLIDLLDNEIEEYKRILIGDADIEKYLYNRKMEAVMNILDEKGIIKKDEIEKELRKMNVIK